MVAGSSAVRRMADDELFIERMFEAPRRLVFKAWTAAEYQMHWFGPKNFTVHFCEIDFRVGGKYRARIRSPEGQDYTMYGVYHEIVAPQRLVFTFAWEEEGERGLKTLVTIDFIDQGDKTLMSFHQAPFQSLAERDGHNGGWTQCFDRLAAYLVATA